MVKIIITRKPHQDINLPPIEIEVDSLSQVSDGYHTIEELYDHRIALFITLCRSMEEDRKCTNASSDYEFPPLVWRSRLHSDETSFEGWFILGINKKKGEQISYHLPMSRWDETDFAKTLDRAPEWDGHTQQDVLERLKTL